MFQITAVAERRPIILLADDEANDILLIRRIIKRLDIADRVVAVSAGEEVIAYLEGNKQYGDRQAFPFPDLILLDHYMPRWSGLEVLHWIRRSPRFQRLPVVMLSLLSPTQADAALRLKALWIPKSPQLGGLSAAMHGAFAVMRKRMRRSDLGATKAALSSESVT